MTDSDCEDWESRDWDNEVGIQGEYPINPMQKQGLKPVILKKSDETNPDRETITTTSTSNKSREEQWQEREEAYKRAKEKIFGVRDEILPCERGEVKNKEIGLSIANVNGLQMERVEEKPQNIQHTQPIKANLPRRKRAVMRNEVERNDPDFDRSYQPNQFQRFVPPMPPMQYAPVYYEPMAQYYPPNYGYVPPPNVPQQQYPRRNDMQFDQSEFPPLSK